MKELFFTKKEERDERCHAKDTVSHKYFGKLTLHKNFKAAIMPSLYGPEAYWLVSHKVNPHNLFAIEKDKATHHEIVNCTKQDRKPLKGMQTTIKPNNITANTTLVQAFESTNNTGFDFIYLDFLSVITDDIILKAIDPIFNPYCFNGKLLKPDGVLMLTYAKRGRCRKENLEAIKGWEHVLAKTPVGEGWCMALSQNYKKKIKHIETSEYKSKTGANKHTTFCTTFCQF